MLQSLPYLFDICLAREFPGVVLPSVVNNNVYRVSPSSVYFSTLFQALDFCASFQRNCYCIRATLPLFPLFPVFFFFSFPLRFIPTYSLYLSSANHRGDVHPIKLTPGKIKIARVSFHKIQTKLLYYRKVYFAISFLFFCFCLQRKHFEIFSLLSFFLRLNDTTSAAERDFTVYMFPLLCN